MPVSPATVYPGERQNCTDLNVRPLSQRPAVSAAGLKRGVTGSAFGEHEADVIIRGAREPEPITTISAC